MDDLEAPRASAPVALWLALASLVLILVGVLGVKLWPLLYPSAIEVAHLAGPCDLRAEACLARFEDGSWVRLEIRPRGIPPAAPLELEVEVGGLTPEGVEVDFAGVDMYMGFNRVTLAASAAGRYLGQGMIPVCIRERMTWEARVLLYTQEGLLAAPFQFDTAR